jgi:hypothetical protein
VQGDATVDAVFAKIDELLGSILEKKNEMVSST